MKAIIVGSGPSARGFEAPEGVLVIGVNGAHDWLNRLDYWFTLDPSMVNLRRMNMPRPGVKYVAAVPPDVPLPAHVDRYNRVSGRGDEPSPKLSPAWWFWRWSCVPGLSEIPGNIHTGNSAYGALGLAYHLGATEALLVGIDATTDPRVEGGTPNNLSHLPMLFRSAEKQMRISSVSGTLGLPVSTVEGFLHD